ncbi:MAG: OOP family OmpA-OmpF porin [Cellvibrionaceae bacterium]
MRKIIALGTLVTVTASLSTTSFGHSGQWVADSSGKKISDSFGRCITSDNGVAIEACDPVKAVKAKPAPVAATPKKEPAPAPELKPAPIVIFAPEPVEVRRAYTLAGDALFESNKSQLSDQGGAALDRFVVEFNAVENLEVNRVSVVGHADSRGSEAYNQSLSENRAAIVGSYLISKGIPASLISTSGRGENDPIAANATAKGRARNRRVEISLLGFRILKDN